MVKDDVQLIKSHRQWMGKILKNGSDNRDAKWTESIAVGDKEFVPDTKEKLGEKASMPAFPGLKFL